MTILNTATETGHVVDSYCEVSTVIGAASPAPTSSTNSRPSSAKGGKDHVRDCCSVNSC